MLDCFVGSAPRNEEKILRPEEHEPHDRQNEDRCNGADREQCQDRRPRLRLPRFGGCFDNPAMSVRVFDLCHDILIHSNAR